ncbi:hypothetical protein M408DRAFT_60796 [Serendipita vermifera MAFF 305830]|uniref:START domain-containing protein n=1 Tax=Serendipita vermifera MAFF 305830 TaxID=933852 RepID=A0A0C3BBL8_SERVB|nr:hypothetical protein M408DRAFT_60796 [Serendipita vermifera MAFF 305830]
MRQEWDPAVESSQLVEILDADIRVAKTYFTLGWPANPRDAITISRTLADGATLLDVTTSLPRSPDEPPYLRPTPPYVRSHVHLFAWVIQQLPSSPEPRIRLTCFWQHDLKAVLGMGMPSRAHHLCSLMVGAVRAVNKFGNHIPMLQGFGLGVGIDRMVFDVGRKSLIIDYSIVNEQEGDDQIHQSPKGMDDIRAKKERRRLDKSVEFVLPQRSSWDVQMATRTSSSEQTVPPWIVNVYRDAENILDQDQLLLRTRHAPPPSVHAIVKVKLVIEAAAGSSGLLRLNGHPHPVETLEARDPTAAMMIPEQLLQDASNTGALSFNTPIGGQHPFSDEASRTMSTRTLGNRSEGSQKSIMKLVKRNYVYFASLLQEPEVKWKPLVEARGVAVTQLDSIDPTLVVYRAEAVFVGVSVWDLISVISSPGSTIHWDKAFDSANLLEDVSELSQLWHYKTRPAWPVNARESVLLKSTYKSPTSVHVFSFSTDDSQLFPSIPPTDPSIIRTQVDLRGWAIEALSPNTTQVTLIEQSDPKGWSNKASLPQQIIAAVSGVGDFVIKSGGPPMLSRLCGAPDSVSDLSETLNSAVTPTRPFIECELRCDIDVWGGPLEIVVDPPPQSVSCLRRHRLSDNGGGLWITIEHDADFVLGERLKVVVRKGATSSAKDRSSVFINGVKAKVELQDIPEAELKLLAKRKRVKPIRIPLDQPPVVGAIQRRRAEWAADAETSSLPEEGASSNAIIPRQTNSTLLGNTFGRFMTMAVSQGTSTTLSAMSAVAKPFALTEQSVPTSSKLPMQHALDALSYLRTLYTRPSQDGWLQINETSGLAVYKKLETEVSRTIPVHKASKVIEGVAAEEIVNILSSYDCRKLWDERFDSAVVLQDYGHGCLTAFTTIKGAFPFQPRGFYTASVLGCSSTASAPGADTISGAGLTPRQDTGHTVYYLATSSFNPESAAEFSSTKYNPFGYAVGRVLVRGWICETLDPYTDENYAIPSTRITFVSAVDFAGAVPAAYNSVLNASIPRSILQLESYLKTSYNLPIFHQPSVGVAIEPNEGPQEGWSFERRDHGVLLLGRRFDSSAKEFRAIVSVQLAPNDILSHDVTPTPSGFISAGANHRQRAISLSPPGGYESPRSQSPEGEAPRPSTVGRASTLRPSSPPRSRRPLVKFFGT